MRYDPRPTADKRQPRKERTREERTDAETGEEDGAATEAGLSAQDLVNATPALPSLGLGGVLLWHLFRS